MVSSLTTLLLVVLAPGQDTKLEIADPHTTYGYLGAKRPKGVGALPGETVYFTFDIKNLKLDKHGRATYSIGVEVFDEKGELAYEQKPRNAIAQNYFGGNSLPCSTQMDIPHNAKPGIYSWRTTVKDRADGRTVTIEGKGHIRPLDFGLIQVGTYADPEAKVPISPIGVVGRNLYLSFSTIGFQRDSKTKQPNIKTSLRILDEAGKPTFAEPLDGQVNADVPEELTIIPMQFGMTMNRPGRYTIELTAQDALSGKNDRVSIPVRILEPE
jgi:hypothetical protein